MRRLARISLLGLLIISLVLSVATASLALRSQSHIDSIWYSQGHDAFHMNSEAGSLELSWVHRQEVAEEPGWQLTTSPMDLIPREMNTDFRAQHQVIYYFAKRNDVYTLTQPHWFLALITALPLAGVVLRLRTRRRNALAGQCPVCGYDLRATPRQCPECGSMTANAANTD